jgi:RimJ/RimL family protein N-acetyltransferase
MSMPIEFDTQRLVLRQWRATDRAPFAALNADPLVMTYFPAPLTREESDAMADRCERLIAERGWGAWAAEIKATGQFIGCVGLHIPRNDLPLSPCVEILWRLARAHWRLGLATEAARGALHIGFDVLQLPEILAFTVPSNSRSRAVMERLGMQMDAATFEHPGLPEGHALRTHCSYRLSRRSWLDRNGAHGSGTRSSSDMAPRAAL